MRLGDCVICRGPLVPAGTTLRDVDSLCPNCGIYYNSGEAKYIMKGNRVFSLDVKKEGDK